MTSWKERFNERFGEDGSFDPWHAGLYLFEHSGRIPNEELYHTALLPLVPAYWKVRLANSLSSGLSTNQRFELMATAIESSYGPQRWGSSVEFFIRTHDITVEQAMVLRGIEF